MGWKSALLLLVALGVTLLAVLWTVTAPPRVPSFTPTAVPAVPCPPEVMALARDYQAGLDQGSDDAELLRRLERLTRALRQLPEGVVLPQSVPGLQRLDRMPPIFTLHYVFLNAAVPDNRSGEIARLVTRLEGQIATCSPTALRELLREVRLPGRIRLHLAWVEDLLSPEDFLSTFAPRPNGLPPWLVERDESQAVLAVARIRAWHKELLLRRDWSEFCRRRVAVENWREATSNRWLESLAAVLHPGWAAATRGEMFLDEVYVSILKQQARLDALEVKIACALWPTGADVTPRAPDPFDPSRRLMLRNGEVWSVGPDKVEDGHAGAGPEDFTYRGDFKL